MTTVALVSCVKTKLKQAAPAQDLYISPLFKGMRAYAEKHADDWYILSAKHGLVEPMAEIEPYEQTLNQMTKRERLVWSGQVALVLEEILPKDVRIIMLAGKQYRKYLDMYFRGRGTPVFAPLDGKGLGEQLKFFNDARLLPSPPDPPCGGNPSCKTHRGGKYNLFSKEECRV